MNLSRRRILELLAWTASLALAPAAWSKSLPASPGRHIKLVMIDGWILREDDLQDIFPDVA